MKRFLLVLTLSVSAAAQDIRIPINIQNLEHKASEVVDVNLDGAMLKFAARFLEDEDSDEKEAKELIKNLKGIYVRNFEFDKPGEYSLADVEEVRNQLKPPTWQRIVGVRSKRDGDNADIFLKIENNEVVGLAVIDAEPRELTIVNIVGPIKPEQLSSLGGHFGVPRVDADDRSSSQKGGTK
jgi:hypothetical protein